MDIKNSLQILQKVDSILFGDSIINRDLDDWKANAVAYKQTPSNFTQEFREKIDKAFTRIKLLKNLTTFEKMLLATLGVPDTIYEGKPSRLQNVSPTGLIEGLALTYQDLLASKSALNKSIIFLDQLSILEPSVNDGEGMIEIVFDGDVKIDNVTEGKEQFNDWYVILDGYAQLLDIDRNDFEIMEMTKSSPTRMRIKTKDAIIATLLATIVPLIQLETAFIGHKTMIANLQANPIGPKELQNQYVQAAKDDLSKRIDMHIDEIVEQKMREHNSKAEKKAAIHMAIVKQYKFITNGGDVKFYLGENSDKEEEIAKLEADKVKIKELRDSLTDLKLIANKKPEEEAN
ncbi:MAG: hypothetical protein JWQ38_281 [Flavipsychrobacter sp.]|nr:hypothetical protein [Flavipsychrobacter sp.]